MVRNRGRMTVIARGATRAGVLTLLSIGFVTGPVEAQEVSNAPDAILGGVPFDIEISGAAGTSSPYEVRTRGGTLLASGTVAAGAVETARGLVISARDALPLVVQIGGRSQNVEATYAPGWFSIVPPLIAIALALIFKEVISALFAGVWLGAMAVSGFNPLTGLGRLIDTFVVPALGNVEDGQTHIVAFSLLLGGMVGVIARNGGTRGIVDALKPLATSARRGKLATWGAGLAIFFDDYANTLLVGNTMRPITDRLKISREKLAYLVDSTAAPVAAIVPISTWVGYEISLINDGLGIAAIQQADTPQLAETLSSVSPFGVFLETIPYLFYPILALFFVLLTSVTNRDFGPMARAEVRAARGEGLFGPDATLAAESQDKLLEPPEGAPLRWWNAALPVLTVVLVVLVGLYQTGRASAGPEAALRDVFSAADPFATLLWGSLAGSLMAIVLSVVQRILSVKHALDAWVGGMRAMLVAMVILILAWSLGAVTEELGTARFLAGLLEGAVPVRLLPALTFVVSGAMAFATGTSWATMAVMLPLVIPLTVALGGPEVAFGGAQAGILIGTTASVLAGAIWGDHCSPISDTTVLSSMASSCDHIDHVRTQLPYAVIVGLVGLLVGNVGTAYGLPSWMALILGAGILVVFLHFVGTPSDRVVEPA
jgi:Na+/H+ antiporter NhaC